MLNTASFASSSRETLGLSPLRRSTVWVSRRKRTLFLLQASDPPHPLTAQSLGRYMDAGDLGPDLVILGADHAAQTTWSALEPFFSYAPRLWMEPQFDTATLEERMDILRGAPCDAEKILVIAQAPALLQLAATLARGYGPARARNARHQMLRDFPQGALAIVSLSLPRWSGLAPKMGLMKAFVRPQDLQPQQW